MRQRFFSGLWRQPEFVKLWAGQTVSRFGSEISELAIPLTAALVLNASPAQMGLLGALEFTPFLMISLLAGVWVDRLPRRRVLIVADIGRALLLGSIPAAALLGRLRIEHLYGVALLAGVLTVFFDVAYQAYLPVLVSRQHLVEGNAKLEASRSLSQIVGKSVAGALVQVLSAPLAVACDAASFVISVFSLLLIRTPEPPTRADRAGPSIWAQLGEGLAVVFGNPLLRSIAACTGTLNLCYNGMLALYVLYATRELGIGSAVLGIIFSVGGVGGLLGALCAGALARHLGLGRAIISAAAGAAVSNLLVPLASGPAVVAVGMLLVAAFVSSVGSPVYNVNQVSLRQTITPDHLQGRMNASMRFIVWGTIPLGPLLAGFLGELIGVRSALAIMALGSLLGPMWLLLSPVRVLRHQPVPA